MFHVEECPLRRLSALEPHFTLAVALASPETWYGAAHVLSLLGTVNLRAVVASWSLFGGACAALWIASIYDQYREGASSLTSSMTGAAAAAGTRGTTDGVVGGVTTVVVGGGVSRARRRSLIRICSYSVFLLGSVCLYLSLPVAKFLLSSAMSTKLRAEPYQIAVDVFEERLASGRVVRVKGWYDLYLPPSLSSLPPDDSDTCVPSGGGGMAEGEGDGGSGREAEAGRTCPGNERPRPMRLRGLVFYPGALVPHVAYSTVASLLSDRGVATAVPDTEPFRRPWGPGRGGGLGASSGDAERIAMDAEARIRQLLPPAAALASAEHGEKEDGGSKSRSNDGDGGGIEVDIEWSVGGHSMGGYAAMWIALDQRRRRRRQKSASSSSSSSPPVLFGKVVTWGAAAGPNSMFGSFVPDLSGRFGGDGGGGDGDPLRVLAVLASNDDFAGFATPEDEASFRSRMPPDSTAAAAAGGSGAGADADGDAGGRGSLTIRTIEGGNHGGFASYRNHKGGGGGGERTIPWREQHRAAADLTADFLLDR